MPHKTTDQKIIELPAQRPDIRPDEDPAGHVCGLVRMLTEPEGEAA